MVEAILEILLGLAAMVVTLAFSAFMLLGMYGVAVLVLRHAFGIELPNPVGWLPPEWQRKLSL